MLSAKTLENLAISFCISYVIFLILLPIFFIGQIAKGNAKNAKSVKDQL